MTSRVLTQMYIVTRTSDGNPVSCPMSYLLISSQHIPRKVASTPASNTHRYAGGTAHIRLRNRMTRHESRRLSPNIAGPNVPEANLGKYQIVGFGIQAQLKRKAHVRQDIHIRRQPYEEYLDKMRFCFVLDGDGLDTYQVQGERVRFAVWHATFKFTD